MESLKELYRIGSGPSSSHTMGPKRAAERFAERCRDVDAYRVTLYGSLAATGKGHLTDVAILSVLEPAAPTRIVWKPEVVLPFHPNGMLFEGLKGDEVSIPGPFTASAAGRWPTRPRASKRPGASTRCRPFRRSRSGATTRARPSGSM